MYDMYSKHPELVVVEHNNSVFRLIAMTDVTGAVTFGIRKSRMLENGTYVHAGKINLPGEVAREFARAVAQMSAEAGK